MPMPIHLRGNTNMNEELKEAQETYIGRLFTLGGRLFLIGSLIAAAVAYKAYNRLLQNQKTN